MEIVLDFLYPGQPGKVKGEYFTLDHYMQFLLLMFLGSISGVRMTKHPSPAGFLWFWYLKEALIMTTASIDISFSTLYYMNWVLTCQMA